MASLKCCWCEIRWPHDERFNECPQCREHTQHTFSEPTITPEDAESTAAQAHFGWWLWDTGTL